MTAVKKKRFKAVSIAQYGKRQRTERLAGERRFRRNDKRNGTCSDMLFCPKTAICRNTGIRHNACKCERFICRRRGKEKKIIAVLRYKRNGAGQTGPRSAEQHRLRACRAPHGGVCRYAQSHGIADPAVGKIRLRCKYICVFADRILYLLPDERVQFGIQACRRFPVNENARCKLISYTRKEPFAKTFRLRFVCAVEYRMPQHVGIFKARFKPHGNQFRVRKPLMQRLHAVGKGRLYDNNAGWHKRRCNSLHKPLCFPLRIIGRMNMAVLNRACLRSVLRGKKNNIFHCGVRHIRE